MQERPDKLVLLGTAAVVGAILLSPPLEQFWFG